MKKHDWLLRARDFEFSRWTCKSCGMERFTKSNRQTASFPTNRYELNGITTHGKAPPCVKIPEKCD